jgi:hypothetical protein
MRRLARSAAHSLAASALACSLLGACHFVCAETFDKVC